jgi:hypothetical protein
MVTRRGGDSAPERGRPEAARPNLEAPSVVAGAPPAADVVFRARGVTKVYEMGEVRVHALRGVDLDLYAGELVVLLMDAGTV